MTTVFTCDNSRCGRDLSADHVILITTMHMRRFCCVECIIEGYQAHLEQLQNGS